MTQRLLRAKRKMRDVAIPFRVPSGDHLAERLNGVLAVRYLIFNEGYQATGGVELSRLPLTQEAIILAGLLAELMPHELEVLGLLALMELHDARRASIRWTTSCRSMSRTAPAGTTPASSVPRPGSTPHCPAITCCRRRAPICCAAWSVGTRRPAPIGTRWRWSATTPSGGSSSAASARCYRWPMPDLDLVRRLVRADHGLAIVSALREDGTVHTSLVTAGVLVDPISGEPVVGFVAAGSALKLRLLRRTGRCTVTFRAGWEWAAVEGPVTLIGPDDAVDGFEPAGVPQLLRAVFTSAGGTHEDWDEFDRVMAAERRVAVLVTPARIASNG
jgi:PPOX class probable F420-dependent enzyme